MTKVKICGLSTTQSLDAALDGGADYVGLVHFAKSPRHVDLDQAALLCAHARGRRADADVVVLLVDPDDVLVDAVAARVKPDTIQLHGTESLARVAEIRARTGLRMIKAHAVSERDDVVVGLGYLAPGRLADLILFDAKPVAAPGGLPGGNGLSFDWHLLQAVPSGVTFALAGGLTPENVAAAIELTGASVVDVSSGVETAPGQKDAGLIRRFLQTAKAANQA